MTNYPPGSMRHAPFLMAGDPVECDCGTNAEEAHMEWCEDDGRWICEHCLRDAANEED